MSTTNPVHRPRTYSEIRTWDDDTRWELIDGQPYAMTAPSTSHQSVVMGLAVQLYAHFQGRGCRVLTAPLDVRLPRGDEADDEVQTVVQPDMIVVCDREKLDDRGCRGAPDVVIEVLSPSTAGRDHVTKRALYERHGVRQYWLVHPTDRLVNIYRRQGKGYGAPEVFEARGTTPMQGYEGLTIDWDQAFVDVPPPT